MALRLARGSACARTGLACRLLATCPTPRVVGGRAIDTAKARAIDDATVVLSDELASAVQDRCCPRRRNRPWPNQGRARPRGDRRRPRRGRATLPAARRDRAWSFLRGRRDGLTWALLTATQAAGAFTWLTRLARGLGSDDPRSMDTRRADILAALLSGQLVTNPDTGTTPDSTTPADTTEDDESTGDTPTGEHSSRRAC